MYYAMARNQLFLYNDAGTSGGRRRCWGGGDAEQQSVLDQCWSGKRNDVGTNLTLNLPVTFAAGYAGAKTTYLYAAGSSASSGWQTMGSWTVAATSAAPTTVSVRPSSVSGSPTDIHAALC
jgi:hypothetical protein